MTLDEAKEHLIRTALTGDDCEEFEDAYLVAHRWVYEQNIKYKPCNGWVPREIAALFLSLIATHEGNHDTGRG